MSVEKKWGLVKKRTKLGLLLDEIGFQNVSKID